MAIRIVDRVGTWKIKIDRMADISTSCYSSLYESGGAASEGEGSSIEYRRATGSLLEPGRDWVGK